MVDFNIYVTILNCKYRCTNENVHFKKGKGLWKYYKYLFLKNIQSKRIENVYSQKYNTHKINVRINIIENYIYTHWCEICISASV